MREPVRGDRHDLRVSPNPRETTPALWLESGPEKSKEPDGLLLDAIAAGTLDDHLVAIADAVHARRELLRTVRAANAISQLCVGDHVRFNHQVRPRYLEYEHGVITEIEDRCVAGAPLAPGSAVPSGELRCPPLALQRLDRGEAQPAA